MTVSRLVGTTTLPALTLVQSSRNAWRLANGLVLLLILALSAAILAAAAPKNRHYQVKGSWLIRDWPRGR